MRSTFFQPKPINPEPNQLIKDILNFVKDALILINDCYHSAILDWLISIMPESSRNNNSSPSF